MYLVIVIVGLDSRICRWTGLVTARVFFGDPLLGIVKP